MHKAKQSRKDEFYTQYQDIEREINAYLDKDENLFRDKVILLPCDDPEWSNFTKYFAQNFERFGIKKLISTSYAADSKPEDIPYQLTLFETDSPKYDKKKTRAHGKIFILEKDANNDNRVDINDLQWEYLKGDGDFSSAEITKLRDQCDFIITNPPFSLFRKFLSWVIESNKQFCIIGGISTISDKQVFPLIKNGKMWLGNGFHKGNAYFRIPENLRQYYDSSVYDPETNLVKFRNCCWYTNIDFGSRHKQLPLMDMASNIKFSKHKEIKEKGYQKYDNYDAIEVPYTDAIPSDYKGVMGVPVSFLSKYCPEQFEILGSTQRGCHEEVPETKTYNDFKEINYKTGKPTGSSGNKTNGNGNLPGIKEKNNYFLNEKTGEIVHSTFSRIFIKSKEPK